MLLDDIKSDMIKALKNGESFRVGTLRFLIAEVENIGMNKYGAESDKKITDEDVLSAIKKQVKTHKESIIAFQSAGRRDLSDKEQKELDILSVFLPQELSDEALKQLLIDVVGSGEKDFGKLMRAAMGKVGGKADGGRVAGLLKQMITN